MPAAPPADPPAAAGELYRRYADRVRRIARAALSRELARRVDADDIVQGVFRRFLRAARGGRCAAAGRSPGVLLAVITRNLVRSEEVFHRAGRRDLRQTVGWGAAEPPGSGPDALDRLAVADALGRLPDRCREVVRLRLDGYEVGEIAARTGRSRRTVERALGESRARLRSLLLLES
ncbi:MAG: hypothetical protein C0501_04510 [Isosphaera sp.]|nr:hypothetical protein [Isosphaera sp.]